MAKVSEETVKDKIYKVKKNVGLQGYRGLVGDTFFEINGESRDIADRVVKSGFARVYDMSVRGKRKLIYESPMNPSTRMFELKNLTDEEIYVLGKAGVIETDKELQKKIWSIEQKKIKGEDND